MVERYVFTLCLMASEVNGDGFRHAGYVSQLIYEPQITDGTRLLLPVKYSLVVKLCQARGHVRRNNMRLIATDFRLLAKLGNGSLE